MKESTLAVSKSLGNVVACPEVARLAPTLSTGFGSGTVGGSTPVESLHVLGCAGSSYAGRAGPPCSSYLVEMGGRSLLLDCGYGSLDALSALVNSRACALDAVILTHSHADHAGDLFALLERGDLWRGAPLVVAQRETIDHVGYRVGSGASTYVEARDGGCVTVGDVALRFSSTDHQVATVAVAVSAGATRLVYSSDTGPRWRPPPAHVGASLAIVECTLFRRRDRDSPYHLDGSEAAALLRYLSPARALVTHVPPGESVSARVEIVGRWSKSAETEAAVAGLRIDFVP